MIVKYLFIALFFQLARGYTKRSECVFPFTYKGEEIHDCIDRDAKAYWCSADKVYVGNFYYCTDDGGSEALDQDGAFIKAQRKLTENSKQLLEISSNSIGGDLPECSRCSASLKVTVDSVRNLRKVANDNERRASFAMERNNKETLSYLDEYIKEIIPHLKCPPGYSSFGEYCYFFGSGKGYSDAETDCVNRGGHLASIHSAEENEFIRSGSGRTNIYIGFNDMKKEGTFEWKDGSKPTYLNWSPGEPNAYPGENCIEQYGNGGWNDIYCSEGQKKYVCKVYIMDI